MPRSSALHEISTTATRGDNDVLKRIQVRLGRIQETQRAIIIVDDDVAIPETAGVTLAEGERFELSVPLPARRISSPVH